LPKYEYKPFFNWVNNELKHDYQVEKDDTGRKWVGVKNANSGTDYAIHWAITTSTSDWNDIRASTHNFGEPTGLEAHM